MNLSVDRQETEAKSRLVHISLLAFNLRLMEHWRSLQLTLRRAVPDYESTMILMAIIVISTEKLLRSDLEPDLESLAHRLPQDRLNRVNLSSVAAATGINRETVRRKVNDLQDAGMVVRDKDSLRIVHGVIQSDVLRESINAQLEAVARIVNQLSRLGALRICTADV